MKLTGPDKFELTFDATAFQVIHPDGRRTFSGMAARVWPKLYVFAAGRQPVYVGITRRPMSARLRMGWNATGESGYHGYALRHHLRAASLFIWYADHDRGPASSRELETVEAEVAFLVRQDGQWPRFQTEIHFYRSDAAHRRLAARVVRAVAGAP